MAHGRLRKDATLKSPKNWPSPRVSARLDEVDVSAICDGARLEAARLAGRFDGPTVREVALTESLATSLVLSGATFIGVRIIDVLFEDCDLSGVTLRDATLRRVEFRNCRLSGLVLPEGRLSHVRFSGCKLNDASFRRSVGEGIHVEDSILTGAEFYGARLTDACFFDCDLSRADFSQSSVEGARFHGSNLDGVRGAESLRNISIDTTQVLDLTAGLFSAYGIRVEDREEQKR